ncbi:hypothetical protein [Ferrimonas sp. SCSIO 43195]|uniref:hypothetical protein n=1 Tax=Ferrimonas sp. SCSIO 43195 TaxID=2822844 RepID=UPI002075084E|nr:hypothetical protein [Ferrimonas sp. SCSIO 43195]USD36252.1 hypothetical protein J8Z22_14620 [Ferrimonas sp. SCSIO 43195]
MAPDAVVSDVGEIALPPAFLPLALQPQSDLAEQKLKPTALSAETATNAAEGQLATVIFTPLWCYRPGSHRDQIGDRKRSPNKGLTHENKQVFTLKSHHALATMTEISSPG